MELNINSPAYFAAHYGVDEWKMQLENEIGKLESEKTREVKLK